MDLLHFDSTYINPAQIVRVEFFDDYSRARLYLTETELVVINGVPASQSRHVQIEGQELVNFAAWIHQYGSTIFDCREPTLKIVQSPRGTPPRDET